MFPQFMQPNIQENMPQDMFKQENMFKQGNMPFQRVTNKKQLKCYEDKLIMIQSKPGFTHMFRLTEYQRDCVVGIMFTGTEYEPVKIPLDHISFFYVAQADYERVNESTLNNGSGLV